MATPQKPPKQTSKPVYPKQTSKPVGGKDTPKTSPYSKGGNPKGVPYQPGTDK